jgi:hypothetical protein
MRVIPLIFKSVKLHPRLEALHYRDFSNEAHQPWDELINDLRDAQASQLTIHYAVWGAKNKMDNVTHKVREKVSAGKLDILVSREILGESAYGDPKKLMVIYSYRGKVNSEEADEDGRLILPR